jgi:hypothetical protein
MQDIVSMMQQRYQDVYAPLEQQWGGMLGDIMAGKDTALTRGIEAPIEQYYGRVGPQLQSQLAAMGHGRGPRGVSGMMADVMGQTGRAEAAAKSAARTGLMQMAPQFIGMGAGMPGDIFGSLASLMGARSQFMGQPSPLSELLQLGGAWLGGQ